MRHMLRSALAGLFCAAMAFTFIVGCDRPNNEPAGGQLKTDSGAVTEGDQTFAGKKTFIGNYGMVGTNATCMILHSCANTAPATALLFGTPGLGGPRVRQLDETLVTCGASVPMTTQIPAGAIILSVQGYVVRTLVAGGTSVTWSLGLTGSTVNAYGTAGYPSAADLLAAKSKSNWLNAAMPIVATANAVSVYACATGGASAGNTAFADGQIRIVVTYIDCASLQSAE